MIKMSKNQKERRIMLYEQDTMISHFRNLVQHYKKEIKKDMKEDGEINSYLMGIKGNCEAFAHEIKEVLEENERKKQTNSKPRENGSY